ncbi:MAG: hypothetical protein E5X53_05395 [Mesorhizobium sp.]|uniref:hypothetical protein n=1 Tax=Mesorhizobium sp. TaxID=1871066 RepID=UPI000FEA63F5|nr:hypothetical protein [Mesorhizobium sp.]RWM15115.1 MAG: hypothetical protein EOR73_25125 [Mesorhizobium sp.]TIP75812.1 MAG: hypothetical protein E5X55_01690 [Mesorhizobium sp.]TIQ12615.1 MAG: hypothetical protein E5X57_13160 [Mesorhizobium sp.]TIR53677.1 MAG: hypothetical protein E5X53_05395 [Mesorhizobium sp.]TJV95117.1 MAG: hypothetical protein E5X52_25420 [Mesorhizobium sp.]
MSIVHRVGPVLDQAIDAVLNRAGHGNTVSVKAALNQVRQAAPGLVASNDDLTEAVLEVAAALGLFVAFDER